jgi:hypothetical protein
LQIPQGYPGVASGGRRGGLRRASGTEVALIPSFGVDV